MTVDKAGTHDDREQILSAICYKNKDICRVKGKLSPEV